MELKLKKINIKDIKFGDKTELVDRVLNIKKIELIKLIKENSKIKSVNINLARPGEEVRIIPVKDVIEPRCKLESKSEVFSGVINDIGQIGEGETLALKNISVVTTGPIVGFQEGIIDMTGPGAKYTPYSKLNNVIVDITVQDDLNEHEHEEIIRKAGLKTALYLARKCVDKDIDIIEKYEYPRKSNTPKKNLPKAGYVYMLASQGLLHDSYVYGVDMKNIIPSLISPTEVIDGAIVSGNCVSPGSKTTTYIHQNNPIIKELFERDNKDLIFSNIIITNENVKLEDKIRSSDYVSKLAHLLNLDAVIISSEGFGNPTTDLMMNCKKLEQKGIKTVLISNEDAGKDGKSEPLPDKTKEADAIISTGNSNELINLPSMKTTYGNISDIEKITGGFSGSIKDDGSIEVELHSIMSVHNEIGYFNLSAYEI